MRVTLKHIADDTGLSIATVSRALSRQKRNHSNSEEQIYVPVLSNWKKIWRIRNKFNKFDLLVIKFAIIILFIPIRSNTDNC